MECLLVEVGFDCAGGCEDAYFFCVGVVVVDKGCCFFYHVEDGDRGARLEFVEEVVCSIAGDDDEFCSGFFEGFCCVDELGEGVFSVVEDGLCSVGDFWVVVDDDFDVVLVAFGGCSLDYFFIEVFGCFWS